MSDSSSSYATPEGRATLLDATLTLPDAPAPRQIAAVGGSWEGFVDRFMPFVYAFSRQSGFEVPESRLITERSFALLYRLWHRFGQSDYRLTLSDWLKLVVIREMGRVERSAEREAKGQRRQALGPEVPSERAEYWPEAFRNYLFERALVEVEDEFDEEWWGLFLRSWRDDEPASIIAVQCGKPVDFIYKVRLRILHRIRQRADHLTRAFPRIEPKASMAR